MAEFEKPIIVGALNHPGYVAVWFAKDFDDRQRRHVDNTLQNQQRVFAEKLEKAGCDDTSIVLFEGWEKKTFLPAAIIRHWLAEYALTWGWRMGPATDDSHHLRLLVLKDGRNWSPGTICPTPGAT